MHPSPWRGTKDGREFDKPYPWLLADVGTMDIMGNPNGELFHAQAVWGQLKEPMIAVPPVSHPGEEPAKAVWRGTNGIPHWSWKGCGGNPAVAEVYGDGAEAELFLNERSLGRNKIVDCKAVFETTYHPGTLKAVIYDENGRETGRSWLESANDKLEISLAPEKERNYCREPIYIELAIQDHAGHVECNDDQMVQVTVTGGKLLGFGSAAPRTEGAFVSGRYTTYYGKGQIVVMAEDAGEIEVTAESCALGKSSIRIVVLDQ